eukprot:497839-Amphidinium_carterae.1
MNAMTTSLDKPIQHLKHFTLHSRLYLSWLSGKTANTSRPRLFVPPPKAVPHRTPLGTLSAQV